MVMLDTNICIYIIKRKPASVLEHFEAFQPRDILVSSVTTSELYHGVHKSERFRANEEALNEFLLPLNVVDYDESASYIYGEIRADLERRGCVIGPLDLMIAAHALNLGMPLITNNVREFERVPGLIVKDWVN